MIIKKKIIAVIGGEQPSSEEARLAEEVGREQAKHLNKLEAGKPSLILSFPQSLALTLLNYKSIRSIDIETSGW